MPAPGGGQAGRVPAILKFPAADSKLNMGILFNFIKFNYDFSTLTGSKQRITTSTTSAHIALPLPENIREALEINYETTDLGIAKLGATAGAKTADALKEFMGNVNNADSQAGASAAAAKAGIASGAEYLLRSAAQLSGPVAGVLNLGAGNVPNPFSTNIFKNVGIRQHELSFKLFPETPEDSAAIRDIIAEFKYRALPGRDTTGTFLEMPEELQVVFFGSTGLYGFARCVLRNITVDYTPSGAPSFFAPRQGASVINAPQGVIINLSLSEIEQLTKQAFEGFAGNADINNNIQSNEPAPQSDPTGAVSNRG